MIAKTCPTCGAHGGKPGCLDAWHSQVSQMGLVDNGLPLDVICTGEGTHQLTHLGGRPGDYEQGHLQVKCPRCARTAQIGPEVFGVIVETYKAKGLERFDISAYTATVGRRRMRRMAKVAA